MTAGQSIGLDGSSSTAQDSGVLTYTWSIVSGNGALGSNDSASTVLTAPSTNGSVSVKLTVTDQEGGTASTTQVVSITGGTNPVSSSSSSASSGGGGGGAMTVIGLLLLSGLSLLRRSMQRAAT